LKIEIIEHPGSWAPGLLADGSAYADDELIYRCGDEPPGRSSFLNVATEKKI
jgi:hypothetical protein